MTNDTSNTVPNFSQQLGGNLVDRADLAEANLLDCVWQLIELVDDAVHRAEAALAEFLLLLELGLVAAARAQEATLDA